MPRTGAQFRAQFRLMPDRQTLTYQTQTSPGTYSSASVDDCWWRPVTSSAGDAGGVYVRHMRTWFLPKASKPAAPNLGDIITGSTTDIDPASAAYTVTAVSEVGALGCWVCDGISLELQENLDVTATVSRPTNARDAAGRMALTTYTTVAANVPCRLQLTDTQAGDVLGRRTVPVRATLFLAYFVDARARDRVTVSGTDYTVLAVSNPDALDQLTAITVEEIL